MGAARRLSFSTTARHPVSDNQAAPMAAYFLPPPCARYRTPSPTRLRKHKPSEPRKWCRLCLRSDFPHVSLPHPIHINRHTLAGERSLLALLAGHACTEHRRFSDDSGSPAGEYRALDASPSAFSGTTACSAGAASAALGSRGGSPLNTEAIDRSIACEHRRGSIFSRSSTRGGGGGQWVCRRAVRPAW